MKFYAYCCRKDLADRNGGSLVLWHHLHALEELGHENGGMLNLEDSPPDDADFLMFQSEWWYALRPHKRHTNAKWICWLGHFLPHRKYGMPKIAEIEADYFHTQWQGKMFDYGQEMLEKKNKKLYYLPHAGCHKCNVEGVKIDCPETIFIGNTFPERAEEWLDYAKVSKIRSPFEDCKNYYKSAIVSPNLHGDFQKNLVCDFTQIPGYMINERIFQVILSGGFSISDDNPIVRDFFTEEEIPYAKDRATFRSMVKNFTERPEKREPFMLKAKERILKDHLYIHRWRDYLKEICD